MQAGNLLDTIPQRQADEVFETLLARPGMEIQRIVSHGQSSPEGFWYDQPEDEWVLVVSGNARLEFEGQEPLELGPGSYVHIPARLRHRVAWTNPDEPTIWLAIHFRG